MAVKVAVTRERSAGETRVAITPDSAKKLIIVEQATQYAAQNPVPAWLEANFENMSGRVLQLPKRADVNLPINEQLIVELYSK